MDRIKIGNLIYNLLTNRLFIVFGYDAKSNTRKLKNELLLVSLLAVFLFNIHTFDFSQLNLKSPTEHALIEYLVKVNDYFYAMSIPSKAKVCCLHLSNRQAKVWWNSTQNSSRKPNYLGMTVD